MPRADRAGSVKPKSQPAHASAAHQPVATSEGGSWGPMGLALIGCAALTLTRLNSSWVPAAVLAQVATTLLCTAWLERRARFVSDRATRRNLFAIAISVLLAGTVFWQWMVDLWTGQGEAFEILMLSVMQQTTLFLAAFRNWRTASRWSVIISGFLVIFTAAIDGRVAVMALTLLYVFVAAWWLMGDYWQTIAPGLAPSESKKRQPLRWPLVIAILCVGLLAIPLVPRDAMLALKGFMPTSGGDSYGDANARNGVGDGELLVAGTNSASTFGPVDSELFLESTEPTLYDVFSDLYGEAKRKKNFERAVGINNDQMIENHRQIMTSSQASSAFSTARQRDRMFKNDAKPVPADEVLQVAGLVPLHLALATYDRFDGIEWTATPADSESTSVMNPSMRTLLGQHWMHSGLNDDRPWFVKGRTHELRIFHLASNRIPSPPHFAQWSIDQLNRPDFFSRERDGGWIFVDREKIPPLTVIHTSAAAHRPYALQQTDFARRSEVEPITDQTRSLRSVAQGMSRGEGRGWNQIESIIQTVRREVALDSGVELPESVDNAARWVWEQKRGTDFLIATLASQLLESLDYRTRLVAGFYADPKRYDSKLGFTHIFKQDAHVWCEVQTVSGEWIPVEPTRGYQDSAVVWTWADHWRYWNGQFWRTLAAHWYWATAAIAIVGLGWDYRRRMLDELLRFGARVRLYWPRPLTGEQIVRWLERRAKVSGKPRPKAMPILRWYPALFEQYAARCKTDRDASRQAQIAAGWQALQRALYGNPIQDSQSADQHDQTLRALLVVLVDMPQEAFLQSPATNEKPRKPARQRSDLDPRSPLPSSQLASTEERLLVEQTS